jgi:hypothetical protein
MEKLTREEVLDLYDTMPLAFPPNFDVDDFMKGNSKVHNFTDQIEDDFDFGSENDNQTNLVPSHNGFVQTQVTGPFVAYEAKYGQRCFTLADEKLAERTDLTAKQRSDMLSTYSHKMIDLLEPKGQKSHLNEVMEILGAMVSYHPPYVPMSGGPIEPGYFHVIVKTGILRDLDMVVAKQVVTFKKNLLLSVAASEPARYFLTLLESDKWFDFDEPLVGYFSGSKSGGYSFSTLSDDEIEVVKEILARANQGQVKE